MSEPHIVDVRFIRMRDGSWSARVEGERVVECAGSRTLGLAVIRLAEVFAWGANRDINEIDAVLAERERQRALGYADEDDYPDGTGGGVHERSLASTRYDVAFAEQTDALTWAHVLREEVAEVLAERTPTRLLEELHQVAAVAIRWAGSIRRRMR